MWAPPSPPLGVSRLGTQARLALDDQPAQPEPRDSPTRGVCEEAQSCVAVLGPGPAEWGCEAPWEPGTVTSTVSETPAWGHLSCLATPLRAHEVQLACCPLRPGPSLLPGALLLTLVLGRGVSGQGSPVSVRYNPNSLARLPSHISPHPPSHTCPRCPFMPEAQLGRNDLQLSKDTWL